MTALVRDLPASSNLPQLPPVGRARPLPHTDQRLTDKVIERVDYPQLVLGVIERNRLSSRRRERPREHAEPLEELLCAV